MRPKPRMPSVLPCTSAARRVLRRCFWSRAFAHQVRQLDHAALRGHEERGVGHGLGQHVGHIAARCRACAARPAGSCSTPTDTLEITCSCGAASSSASIDPGWLEPIRPWAVRSAAAKASGSLRVGHGERGARPAGAPAGLRAAARRGCSCAASCCSSRPRFFELRARRQAFGVAQHGAGADPRAAAHGVGHAARPSSKALTTPAAKPSPAPTVSITSFTGKPSTPPSAVSLS